MKKLFALLLVTVMLVGLMAGCADSESNGPTTIDFWSFQALHVEFYELMAEKWNAANPDRQIKLNPTVYEFEDMHSKLGVALQSGSGAPDLVDIESGKIANFLKGNIQLEPLNDIVEPELDNIVKARVDIYSKDGKYYGICFHVGAAVIYYNTELCDQAGIDYTNIKTWDEYYAAGQKLKAALPDKYWTSVETTDIWHMYPLLVQAGGDMVDATGKPTIDSDAMVKVLEYNRKLVDEGIAECAPGGYFHAEEFYGQMDKGAYASIVMPMWYMDRFTNYMPDLSKKIAIEPLPVWDSNSALSVGQGGTCTAVTNQAKDKQLVKDFLAFAKLSKEGNVQIWNKLGFDPIRKEVWELPEVVNSDNAFTQFYVNNPFDTLTEIKDGIVGTNNNSGLPATLDAMKQYVLVRAYTDANPDMHAILAEEQAKIQYE